MNRFQELVQLYSDVHNCRMCIDRGSRVILSDPQKVPRTIPERALDSRIMIVLQAPAENQVRLSGVQFHARDGKMGRGGRYLEPFLNRIGYTLSPTDQNHQLAYTTDSVHCFPGKSSRGDVAPGGLEVVTCSEYLKRELKIVGPRVVVSLGLSAARSLAGFLWHKELPTLATVLGRGFAYDGDYGAFTVVFLPHPTSMVKEKRRVFAESFEVIAEAIQETKASSF